MDQDILDKINEVINKQKEKSEEDTEEQKIKDLQEQLLTMQKKKNSSYDLKKQIDNLKQSNNLQSKIYNYKMSNELLLICKYAIIAGFLFLLINLKITLDLFDNLLPVMGRCNDTFYPLLLRCLLFMILFTVSANILFKYIEQK